MLLETKEEKKFTLEIRNDDYKYIGYITVYDDEGIFNMFKYAQKMKEYLECVLTFKTFTEDMKENVKDLLSSMNSPCK